MAESEEEVKSLLMRVKEESKKAGLKLNIQKAMAMASSSITSQQREREKVETVTNFIFLASKITVREGNGNPLQYSCLENLMGGGAWWAAVHVVAQSQR